MLIIADAILMSLIGQLLFIYLFGLLTS